MEESVYFEHRNENHDVETTRDVSITGIVEGYIWDVRDASEVCEYVLYHAGRELRDAYKQLFSEDYDETEFQQWISEEVEHVFDHDGDLPFGMINLKFETY